MVDSCNTSIYNSCEYTTLKTDDKFSKIEGHCSCSIGDLVYTFGGVIQNENDGDISRENKDLNVYDTITEKWSTVVTSGDLPSSRSTASLVAVGDDIYLFGGVSAQYGWNNQLFKFNTKTGEWKLIEHKFAPLPRDKHCAVTFNNDMYIFGGFGPTENERTNIMEVDSSSFTWFNDVFKYDTVKDIWLLLSDHKNTSAPTARAASSLSALRGHRDLHVVLYMFGGRDRIRRQNDFFSFDTITKEWKTIVIDINLPMARSFHKTVTLDYEGGVIALFGGRSNRDKHFADVHIYSRDENSWSKLKNATCSGRGCMTATCVANGNVIMIGGSSGFSAVSMSAEKIHHEIYAIAFHKVKPEEDEVKEVEKIVKEEEKAVNGKVEEEVSPLIIDQRPTDGSGDAPKATLKHSLIDDDSDDNKTNKKTKVEE